MRAHSLWLLPVVSALAVSACVPASRAPIQSAPPVSSRASNPVGPATSLLPVWESQDVSPNSRDVAGGSYTVRAGDTLGAIARQTGAGVEAIARANAIAPPYIIHPGQRLTIPAGRYHEVRRGETGIAIARAYGVDWTRIATLNAFEEPYILRVGERILLPSPAEVSTMSRSERAAAFDLDIDDIITGGEPALAANEAPVPATSTAATRLPPDAAVRSPANFTGRFGWPLTGPIVATFGQGSNGQRNNGIDIAAPRGTPVHAAAGGVVIYAGNEIQVHGGLVLINHGDGWITAYAHLDELSVARGQRVERGQLIARSGDTGFADRPLLHFEIRRNREPVDPSSHLPNLT